MNYLNKPIKEKYLNISRVMKYYKIKMEKPYQWYQQNKVLFHHKIGNMMLNRKIIKDIQCVITCGTIVFQYHNIGKIVIIKKIKRLHLQNLWL